MACIGVVGLTLMERTFLVLGFGFLCGALVSRHIHGGWWALTPFALWVGAAFVDMLEQEFKRHPDDGVLRAVIRCFSGEKTEQR